MDELSNFKNHLVFDSKFKPQAVNTLDKSLKDFSPEDDKALCGHCFFGGNTNVPILKKISKPHSKRKTPRSNPGKIKKKDTAQYSRKNQKSKTFKK